MTTDCSLAQMTPLSNVLDNTIEPTESRILAVSSINTAALPAPTPIAGFPDS